MTHPSSVPPTPEICDCKNGQRCANCGTVDGYASKTMSDHPSSDTLALGASIAGQLGKPSPSAAQTPPPHQPSSGDKLFVSHVQTSAPDTAPSQLRDLGKGKIPRRFGTLSALPSLLQAQTELVIANRQLAEQIADKHRILREYGAALSQAQTERDRLAKIVENDSDEINRVIDSLDEAHQKLRAVTARNAQYEKDLEAARSQVSALEAAQREIAAKVDALPVAKAPYASTMEAMYGDEFVNWVPRRAVLDILNGKQT